MPYLYLISSVFLSASSSLFGKTFNRRNGTKKDATVFYIYCLMICACIGWAILWLTNFSFDANVLWYSALFSICYIATNIGSINALKHGPVALTSLMNSLSLILTTIWGFIFWGSKLTVFVVLGLILVVCALFLCLYSGKKDEKKVSLKWLIFVTVAFFGNAGCSIVQRTQQMVYNGQHGNQLMFFALLISVVAYSFVYFKSDRTDSPLMLKTSAWIPLCSGSFNLVLNVFVMLMATTTLSPSLIYPVIGVGALAVVTIFSLVVFKEKMSWRQWTGIGVGALAVALLSIR